MAIHFCTIIIHFFSFICQKVNKLHIYYEIQLHSLILIIQKDFNHIELQNDDKNVSILVRLIFDISSIHEN
jgi:hypothetical protein